MKLETLDYVILLSDDLAAMKSFYLEAPGFPSARDWEDWIERWNVNKPQRVQ